MAQNALVFGNFGNGFKGTSMVCTPVPSGITVGGKKVTKVCHPRQYSMAYLKKHGMLKKVTKQGTCTRTAKNGTKKKVACKRTIWVLGRPAPGKKQARFTTKSKRKNKGRKVPLSQQTAAQKRFGSAAS